MYNRCRRRPRKGFNAGGRPPWQLIYTIIRRAFSLTYTATIKRIRVNIIIFVY